MSIIEICLLYKSEHMSMPMTIDYIMRFLYTKHMSMLMMVVFNLSIDPLPLVSSYFLALFISYDVSVDDNYI